MKREITSGRLIALLAVYFAFFLNPAFWRYVWNNLEVNSVHSALFALSIAVLFLLVPYVLFNLIVWPYAGKAILVPLLLLSAAASYFMFDLGVFIDSEMLRNVFETNPREALEMVTLRGVLWMLVFGALPAALLVAARVKYRPFRREALVRVGVIVAAALCLVGIAFAFFKDYAIVVRNNKASTKLINPANYISSTIRYFKKKARVNHELVKADDDASHEPYVDPYKTVLIIMVGETARSMNFSLNGYERKTNPRLEKEDVISFKNVTSAGTATAFSLPCMFSPLGRDEFDVDKASYHENLVDVMQNCGYRVLWRDNDDGGKGVNARVETDEIFNSGNKRWFNGDSYYDEALLDGLEDFLRKLDSDAVIVLHMRGSHGPSYYRRYPPEFKVFTPACETADIQSSPREEIVNAYDNTILYSDHVIAETIDILKKFPMFEAGLLYVSDHGESLGENNLYLHGLPYAIAPDEQKRVPMILWMSEAMKREDHVDFEKLRRAADSMALSHDNLFHSILGLVEIKSDLYDPKLDLFADFRTKPLPR